MIYDSDPRVTSSQPATVAYEGDTHDAAGYVVTRPDGTYLVLDATQAGFGWTICYPEPPYEFVMAGDAGFAIGLPDAETAIRALLGPPQLAAVQ